MKVFALDTTRKIARIYIFDEEGNDYTLVMGKDVKHSEGLFLYIEKILFENKMKLGDFDVFAVLTGPGSFTGIRIGVATLKGFNKALNKDIIAINNFELLEKYTKNGVILLDSTLTSCYFAEIKSGKIISEGNIEKSKITDFVNGREVVILKEEQNSIGLEYNNIKVVSNTTDKLKEIIFDKIKKNDYGSLNPYYLQLSQAERNLKC